MATEGSESLGRTIVNDTTAVWSDQAPPSKLQIKNSNSHSSTTHYSNTTASMLSDNYTHHQPHPAPATTNFETMPPCSEAGAAAVEPSLLKLHSKKAQTKHSFRGKTISPLSPLRKTMRSASDDDDDDGGGDQNISPTSLSLVSPTALRLLLHEPTHSPSPGSPTADKKTRSCTETCVFIFFILFCFFVDLFARVVVRSPSLAYWPCR